MNKLEISVSTKEEAIIAEQGGADRLEISIRSDRGGITPNIDTLSEIVFSTKLPCYLMLRHNFESYELDEEQLKKILFFIELTKISGIKGISIGLLKDGRIDRQKMESIINNKGDLEIMFNHAIDSSFNYEEDLEWLINNEGISWIQTSGSAETIFDGYKRILPYKDKINKKLVVGRSLTTENISKVMEFGFDNIVYQCKESLLNEERMLSLNKIKEFKKIINKGSDNNE